MQDQINREAVAITVKASRLTAKGLAKLLMALVRTIKKGHQEAQTPHGKQSIRKLMNHNVPTNTIEISGDKGLFDRVARKWNVDYAFYKTEPNKHLLLFKAGQADAITAAFSEYSKLVMRRSRNKRPPIMEQFKRAAERAERARSSSKHKERKREREAVRE